jgi:flagellar basal body P-ring formation protein FlgA
MSPRHFIAARLMPACAFAALSLPAAASPTEAAEPWQVEAGALVRKAATPAGSATGLRVEVEVGRLDARLKLAPCDKVQTYLPPGFTAWGKTRVGLRCLQGPTKWNVYLPITVKVFGRALVASSALPAGAALAAGDLHEAEVDLAAERSNAVIQPSEALGRHLARALTPGESLRAADLRARQWFAAGETVSVVAVGTGFAVHGEGQAVTPGLDGAAVRVRVENGRIVTGTAVGERRVEIKL